MRVPYRLALGTTLAAVLLTSCGLTPIYSGGERGTAGAMLGAVEVSAIPDRAGFLMRQALLQRLRPGGQAKYRLDVRLSDQIDGYGIRGDNSIARERRTLRARYQLVDLATSNILLDATAGSDEGIDAVSSDFAVVAAETTALERLSTIVAEQIVARIALATRTGFPGPRAQPGSGGVSAQPNGQPPRVTVPGGGFTPEAAPRPPQR